MRTSAVVVLLLTFSALANAGDRGTPAEAKAMLAKAVAHYKEVGRKKALADFTAKKAPFGDRDLYVFCIGADRTIVANGAYPTFVGKSADMLKDANGKLLGGALWEAATKEGGGSVEYPLVNPMTHKAEMKVSFVQKTGDDVCGVGAFKG
jgi:cytochrome c